MLQKGRKTPADSEFCERQRKAFATGRKQVVFRLGVICRTKDGTSPADLPPMIKWLVRE